ncbi:Predicted enzyme of the cupin superfamily [Arboricoccus pini]|uniref:Predicted enzyme of the cupin superfamily n=1 Tax=Arboricoccus pini TaxID=1963835 RepID=A0A212R7B7_9PROT|nr:cupin domain-containing protein [Arboricoccus pini]SNB68052.1 Predicted enzyme of the cupin superfamily [Arboricoccus pini]
MTSVSAETLLDGNAPLVGGANVPTVSKSAVVVAGELYFKPAPIEAEWIVEGQPLAQSAIVSGSTDGMGHTMVWECTAGTFDWHFHFEETIRVLSGEVIVTDEDGRVHRLSAGDTAFFRGGSRARWHIPDHLRKLAFNRRVPPSAIVQAWRAILGYRLIMRAVMKRLGPALESPATQMILISGAAILF